VGLEEAEAVDLSQVAVLIPALDEAETLPGLLAALPAGLGAVVVVDNGSRDGTARVAREGGAQVVPEPHKGYGAACLAGLGHLEEKRPPPGVVVFLDADHARGPAQIATLVAPILLGQADMVLGVRVADPGASASVPAHARWGNRLVLGFARVLFGRAYRDMAPFRAVRLTSLQRLAMDDRTWGWTLQMQVRAARHGLAVAEIELPHVLRTAGTSKISGSLVGSIRAGSKMFVTLAREWMR